MTLSRDDILAIDDLTTREITVPETIHAWGGKMLMIRQLSRGEQDAYLKRQFGETRVKQDKRNTQEMSALTLYGHDAWLCVRGICDEQGKAIFKDEDIAKLNQKNGEAMGWIASEIVKFSGMAGDIPVEEEAKN